MLRNLRFTPKRLRVIPKCVRLICLCCFAGTFYLLLSYFTMPPQVHVYYPPPLDLINMKLTIEEATLCSRHQSDLFLIIVVHSAPAHYKRRLMIRETWGNRRYYDRHRTLLVFTLGQGANSSVQTAIEMESAAYRDLIQGDFVDAYKNLTFKVIMWLKWATYSCAQPKYLVKVDDDMFVNTFSLAKYLHRIYVDKIAQHNSIICLTWIGMIVARESNNKWFVPESDYANPTFPLYCSGSAYVISGDLVPKLYQKVFTTRFFWVDDFYATGLLPKDLDVNYHDIRALYVLDSAKLQEKLVENYAIFAHLPNSLLKQYHLWANTLKQRSLN